MWGSEIRKAYSGSRGLRTLTYFAFGVGAVGCYGMWLARERTIKDIRAESSYGETQKIFEGYKYGVDKIGEPIKYVKNYSYINTQINFLYNDGKNSKMAIPIKGSKTYGMLHSFASRPNKDHLWQVDKVDLQVDGQMWTFYIHPSKRHILKPYQDMTQEDYENEYAAMVKHTEEQLPEDSRTLQKQYQDLYNNDKSQDLNSHIKVETDSECTLRT